MRYLAETLINEMHVVSSFKDLPHYDFLNFFGVITVLKIFLCILGDFHPDILIEAILI